MMLGQPVRCGDDGDDVGMTGTMCGPRGQHVETTQTTGTTCGDHGDHADHRPWGPHGDLLGAMEMTWGQQG